MFLCCSKNPKPIAHAEAKTDECNKKNMRRIVFNKNVNLEQQQQHRHTRISNPRGGGKTIKYLYSSCDKR
jgi:hypothetical protein